VRVGSYVETGKILCIVKRLKLMNEIESDVSGEVIRIFVKTDSRSNMGSLCLASVRAGRSSRHSRPCSRRF